MTIRRSLARTAAVAAGLTALAATGGAAAQSINLDVGRGAGVPGSGFAAAAQPGHWNALGVPGATVALLDVRALPTAARVAIDAPAAAGAPQVMLDDPGTGAAEQQLLDDFLPCTAGAPVTVTLTGLRPGLYDVVAYAWVPVLTDAASAVTLPGSAATEVGGAWPGSLVAGVTHVRRTLRVTGAPLVIRVEAAAEGGGALNGLQLVLRKPARAPEAVRPFRSGPLPFGPLLPGGLDVPITGHGFDGLHFGPSSDGDG